VSTPGTWDFLLTLQGSRNKEKDCHSSKRLYITHSHHAQLHNCIYYAYSARRNVAYINNYNDDKNNDNSNNSNDDSNNNSNNNNNNNYVYIAYYAHILPWLRLLPCFLYICNLAGNMYACMQHVCMHGSRDLRYTSSL
jgi:hypothetical protein